MELFAKRLRERAGELGLSDAEVARRVGLDERRYGHYVRATREPDFATLLRICDVLDVTPNDLLIPQRPRKVRAQDRWLARLNAAGRKLAPEDVKLAVHQMEVLVQHRDDAGKRASRSSTRRK